MLESLLGFVVAKIALIAVLDRLMLWPVTAVSISL